MCARPRAGMQQQEVAGPESGGLGRLRGRWGALEAWGARLQSGSRAPGGGDGIPGPQTGPAHGPPPGLAYICEGLKEQRKGLATLVLWNNQLTHTGMAFLGMTLVSGPESGASGPVPRLCPPTHPPSSRQLPVCCSCPLGRLTSPFLQPSLVLASASAPSFP